MTEKTEITPGPISNDRPILSPYETTVMMCLRFGVDVPSISDFYKAPHAPRGTPARRHKAADYRKRLADARAATAKQIAENEAAAKVAQELETV